ncbi:MAG TPA: hypothetical protein VF343_03275, partial [Syntrophales bacterium]
TRTINSTPLNALSTRSTVCIKLTGVPLFSCYIERVSCGCCVILITRIQTTHTPPIYTSSWFITL